MLWGRGGVEMSSYDVTLTFICLEFSCQRHWQILLFPNCLLAKLSGPRASWLRLAC